MNENSDKIVKIEIKGFYDLCERLKNLEEENKQLKANNQIMADELTYFKEYAADLEEDVTRLKSQCRKLSRENHDLALENKDMKFTRKFLTAEDAGKQLACSLLGTPTTEDEAIAEGEAIYETRVYGTMEDL